MNLHNYIIILIQNSLKETGNPLSKPLLDKSPDELCKIVFANVRRNGELLRGYNLTAIGLTLLKPCFDYWEFSMSKDFKIVPRHLLYLDRNLKLPYHISSTLFTTFEENFALKLKLVDSDLDRLIDIDKKSRSVKNTPRLKNIVEL